MGRGKAGIWHGFEMPTEGAAQRLVREALKMDGVRHARSDGEIVQMDFRYPLLEAIVCMAIDLGWSGNRMSWDGVFKRIRR